jgi:hypothetical protein
MPASILRCLVDPLYRLRSAVKRYTTLKASGCNLITHFSYHKCLTSYYQSVVRALSAEFGFYYEHFTSDYPRFEQAALNDPRRRVLSVNNRSDIAWERLPEYRGSHFIRDPRDLVVSGFYGRAKHGASIRDSSGDIWSRIPISGATSRHCRPGCRARYRTRSISARWTGNEA